MFSRHNKIQVKSLCVFERGESIFVSKSPDSVKKDYYYRPVGGTANFGEISIDTLRREITEELGTEIIDATLENVFENVFVCDGHPGHEVIFMYKAKFSDKKFYEKDEYELTESNGEKNPVYWINKAKFVSGELRLVPEALLETYR